MQQSHIKDLENASAKAPEIRQPPKGAFTTQEPPAVLQAAIIDLENQLREAAAVQHDLCRCEIPKLQGAVIRAAAQAARVLTGDVHVIRRLDKNRIAVFLADATGHGIAAAMLALRVQQYLEDALRAHDRSGLVAPDQVLRRMNRRLVRDDLRDCQFAAAVYAVYDEESRELHWARGGAPLPVWARNDAVPRTLESAGALLGISEQTYFESARLRLHPGDMVTFFSDGLEAFLHDRASQCERPQPQAPSRLNHTSVPEPPASGFADRTPAIASQALTRAARRSHEHHSFTKPLEGASQNHSEPRALARADTQNPSFRTHSESGDHRAGGFPVDIKRWMRRMQSLGAPACFAELEAAMDAEARFRALPDDVTVVTLCVQEGAVDGSMAARPAPQTEPIAVPA